ncbi:MAG: DNA-processing protein DprA, partial [Nitrospinota bacterium]|nr:DNA-processing protein DprA [Nitrospinota bacterium]
MQSNPTKSMSLKPETSAISDAWLVLQTLPGITPEKLEKLLAAFGEPEKALTAPMSDFVRISGKKVLESLERDIPADIAKRIRREARKGGANIVTRENPAFPELLRHIIAAPGALFVEGTLQKEDELAIAVVGMRRPTPYGRRMARKLAGGLAERGFTIASGMAYGIDAEAHRAALDAGGRTLAVMGCGLGTNYPADHEDLRKQIAASGAVISEFPWNEPPRKYNFPRRNRLISGLSIATLIVEAAERSGSLITARLALEQGREVMAVPGPTDTGRSAGCHGLLKDGAHLIEKVEDVMEALPSYIHETRTPSNLASAATHPGSPRDESVERTPLA